MTAATRERPQVFVSSPATLTDAQAAAKNVILNELERQQIGTIRVERSQYARTPWEQLRTAISRSDGALVFGFRQLYVATGEWRPDTEEARSGAGRYATAWNQIEAGPAIMARLPVLVTQDPEVTDGVFSPDVWGDQVFGLPQLDAGERTSTFLAVFGAWVSAVVGQSLRRIA